MASIFTESKDAPLAQEMRRFTSLAQEAVEDGIHTTKREMRRRVEQLRDFKDAAVYRVKRQPVQAVSAAFGIGVAFGLIAAWSLACARRPGREPLERKGNKP